MTLSISVGTVVALAATVEAALPPKPTALVCSVQGLSLIKPRMAGDQVCNRIKYQLEQAYSVPLKQLASAAEAVRMKVDWISVDLSFKNPGIVSAFVSRSTKGKARTVSNFSIAFSDRPIDERAVDRVAKRIAASVIGQ